MSICFVCGEAATEENDVIVKKRGVQTLLSASITRGEKVHEEMLRNVDSVVMHVACQKSYANKKLAEARRRSNDASKLPSSSTSTSQALEPQVPTFDFKNLCFICKEDADPQRDRKLPRSARRRIHVVTHSDFRDKVLDTLNERNEDLARKVIARVENVPDLVAVDARYHRVCWFNLQTKSVQDTKGRPASDEVNRAMEDIFQYIEDHSDECQFTMTDLKEQIEGDFRPHNKTIKQRLQEEYGSEMLLFDAPGVDKIFCFRNTGYKILSKNWYEAKKSDPSAERLRVVREAAAIIVEDIRSKPYDIKSYPPADDFMVNVNNCVPTSLKVLLEEIILKSKKGSLEPWKRKCTSIAHAIISAVGPRSFISSLQIGVGAFLYKKFGSRTLINVVSSLGLCSSYNDVSKFEAASIMRPQRKVKDSAFTQFVYDNADFNINTLDGHGAFHCMGGIQCISPFDAIEPDVEINRDSEKRSAATIAEAGRVEIQYYGQTKMSGLAKLKVAEIVNVASLGQKNLPTFGDFMWLYGKWACGSRIPGWNGFMEEVTANQTFARTKIVFMPFIHAPPSNYDTIYTTLNFALNQNKASNCKSCIVTFDQPLYWKARDIVANADPSSEIGSIIVRLGGFHIILSFLGAIGHVMSGSGLEDALKTIYAENSVEKILSGHAYSRAVRAHMLVHLSLAKRIMATTEYEDEERSEVDHIVMDLDRSLLFTAKDNIMVKQVMEKFDAAVNASERNGPTAKLWTQYFKMVTLLKHFLEAERSGNWDFHLDTIKEMLPFFHSSGHFLYAKSAHLYLQDMADLRNKMPANEFEKFTAQGYFTIRRSNKFWSGIMSDQATEQTLNRESKIRGGLFQRGASENVAAKWTMGSIHLQTVCEAVEDFCNIHSATSDQHVDFRQSRVCRDNSDVEKIDQWFHAHDPFPVDSNLMSISTGLIGNDAINCHEAFEIGMKMLTKTIGVTYDALKFTRKDKVSPLSAVSSSVVVDNTRVSINPLLLFQRMNVVSQSQKDLLKNLAHELSPYPQSLFTEEGMRKGTKAALYALFEPLLHFVPVGPRRLDVIDGGFLLHKVVWPRTDATFQTICTTYLSYVKKHFADAVIVVFDGYPEHQDAVILKGWERRRRAAKHNTANIVVNATSAPPTTQEKFLSNDKNKASLINLLTQTLRDADIIVQQAPGDADSFIVGTGIEEARNYDQVTIIGEDIDLILLLTGLGRNLTNVFFKKPSRGRTPEHLYSPASFKYCDSVASHILILHAISGCDTTSSVYNIGKAKFVNTLQKNDYLGTHLGLFKQPNVDPDILATAGERFLITVFGGDRDVKSLNELRYNCFRKSVSKNKFNLASLPPTTEAAREHLYRSYLQVQMWLGYELDATDWGWTKGTRGLEPITTTATPAPDELLKTIACKCKTKCGKMCGCRKAGLKCSALCHNCAGLNCENVTQIQEIINDEDGDMDDPAPSPALNDDKLTEEDSDDTDLAGPSAKQQRTM